MAGRKSSTGSTSRSGKARGTPTRRTRAQAGRRGDAPQARGDLTLYNAKRHFDRTAEPRGERAAKQPAQGLSFFIQRHHARALHYDFRLEWDGVLKSWAVPKGPSLDPGALRLAVQVEDHPLAYGTFEGAIPAGEYGAGDVVLWDRGTWVPRDDPGEGLVQGKLHFELRGTKLHGNWVLFRSGRNQRHWMLRKLDDAHAVAGDGNGITERRPESVLKRSAATPARSTRQASATAARGRSTTPTTRRDAARLPTTLRPQLAVLVGAPPAGDGWRYEVKYDGYRMLARLSGGAARIVSRNASDWTAKLPAIAAALGKLAHDAWLDGEIVVFDAAGRTDFQLLQNALDRGHARHAEIVFVVFDLLFLDGADWRERPWHERVEALRQVLAPLNAKGIVRLGESVAGDGATALRKACSLGLEGVIAKRVDAPYLAGRHDAWRKLKCHAEQEFVIVGYTEPTGSREHVGALLLGVHDANGALRYAGRVGTGFSQDTLAALGKRLAPLQTDAPPLATKPRLPGAVRAHWVRPELVAQVRFAEWTSAGQVRQAAFLGLREDKEAREVTRESTAKQTDPRAARATQPRTKAQRGKVPRKVASPEGATRDEGAAPPEKTAARGRATAAADAVVAGIKVTHPERVVYGRPRTTKLDVVRYYDAVAQYLFEETARRPVSLMRCPQGVASGRGAAIAQCFFQKHLEHLPAGMRAVRSPNPDVADYVAIERPEALVALAQHGTIEFHTWGARLPKLDRPDRLILDLDPDPALGWPALVDAAQLARTLLQELGLPALLKTTGGKGLHVVVPLKPTREWDAVKDFARALAQRLVQVAPERLIATAAKAQRSGKIFVDYLRNGEGATYVAAYSLRARDGAPVAMPIDWDELTPRRDLRGDHFNITNAVARAAESSALWRDADARAVAITPAMRKRAGADPNLG